MTAWRSPRVRGLERRADPLGELVEGQAALDHVLAELGHGPVPVGVGHPLGRQAGFPWQ